MNDDFNSDILENNDLSISINKTQETVRVFKAKENMLNCLKNNYRNIMNRLLIYIFPGILIFCLGLTFSIHSQVGVSPSDVFILSINNAFYLDLYGVFLTIVNLFIFCISMALFFIRMWVKKEKLNWFELINYLLQLVPTFIIGPIITIYELFVIPMHIENLAYYYRVLIFIAGWILYGCGSAFMIWVDIMQQSYNSIVLDIRRMRGWPFFVGRIILDASFLFIGLIITLITRMDKIWTVINVGTIIMTFASAPYIGIILKLLNKIKKFDMK